MGVPNQYLTDEVVVYGPSKNLSYFWSDTEIGEAMMRTKYCKNKENLDRQVSANSEETYQTAPIALRKAKIVYNFGLSECYRVKERKQSD